MRIDFQLGGSEADASITNKQVNRSDQEQQEYDYKYIN